jgi:hypothetical protein
MAVLLTGFSEAVLSLYSWSKRKSEHPACKSSSDNQEHITDVGGVSPSAVSDQPP